MTLKQQLNNENEMENDAIYLFLVIKLQNDT